MCLSPQCRVNSSRYAGFGFTSNEIKSWLQLKSKLHLLMHLRVCLTAATPFMHSWEWGLDPVVAHMYIYTHTHTRNDSQNHVLLFPPNPNPKPFTLNPEGPVCATFRFEPYIVNRKLEALQLAAVLFRNYFNLSSSINLRIVFSNFVFFYDMSRGFTVRALTSNPRPFSL